MPPWNRNAPDPFKDKRRMLAEREKRLAERMSQLREELQQSGEPAASELKAVEPPVWRMEEDALSRRAIDSTPRNLARQRQRDMIWFFVILTVLVVVLIVFWVAYKHSTAPNNGA
jgi:predicted nucleic acid-binding Zn ribbon protein